MPTNGPEKTTNTAGRTTFRPPWVKEGPQPIPMPSAPWTKSKTTPTSATTQEGGAATSATPSKPLPMRVRENGLLPNQPLREVKLQSREIKVPVMTERKRPVQEPLKPREKAVPIAVEEEKPKAKAAPQERPVTVVRKKEEKEVSPVKTAAVKTVKKAVAPPVEKPAVVEAPKVMKSTLKKAPQQEEREEKVPPSNVPIPPPPPPMVGPPPPPPPPPSGLQPPPDFQRKPISEKHKEVLEKLKQRPRRRPDWSDMMQEVEQGRKLKHVQCNDRSKPILKSKTMTKVAGQFVFETEKANVHNILLKQIQGGVKLKPTRCNDRSKPVLAGLRKFRRQMTIEEQIQKSESRAQLAEVAPEEESEDEMDDIDKLRDDLQSTKQMLNLELRSKEAQERENKRLLAKIQILEAELEREKQHHRSNSSGSSSNSSVADEPLVRSLKKDAEEAQKTSKILEKKYQEAAEQLDGAKNEIEEHKRQIQVLEKKLSQVVQGQILETNTRRNSEAPAKECKESSPEPETESSESESEDDDEEKKLERMAKRLDRDVKILRSKLTKFKEKLKMAKKERENLRQSMKSNQNSLKQENKKYKKLQREVDKMAALMKEDTSDDDSEKEEEEQEEEEEEEESEEEETETEESEEETESESESEEENAPNESKQKNLEPRVKRHEGRLSALKKGNYLLQANVDRLQDEITKIREKSSTLQRDLDSVLSELG